MGLTREVAGPLTTDELTAGRAWLSINGDAKVEPAPKASYEFLLFITEALQLDAGVIERFEGLEARVAGLLSS